MTLKGFLTKSPETSESMIAIIIIMLILVLHGVTVVAQDWDKRFTFIVEKAQSCLSPEGAGRRGENYPRRRDEIPSSHSDS